MQADKSFITNFFQPVVAEKESLAIVTTHFQERLLAKNDCWLMEGKMSNEYVVLEEDFRRAFSMDTSSNEVTTAFYKAFLAKDIFLYANRRHQEKYYYEGLY